MRESGLGRGGSQARVGFQVKSGFHPGLGGLRSVTCSTELSPYQLSGALSEGQCSPLGLPRWVKWLGSVNLVAYRNLLHLEQLRDLLSNCCLQVRGTLAPGFPHTGHHFAPSSFPLQTSFDPEGVSRFPLLLEACPESAPTRMGCADDSLLKGPSPRPSLCLAKIHSLHLSSQARCSAVSERMSPL